MCNGRTRLANPMYNLDFFDPHNVCFNAKHLGDSMGKLMLAICTMLISTTASAGAISASWITGVPELVGVALDYRSTPLVAVGASYGYLNERSASVVMVRIYPFQNEVINPYIEDAWGVLLDNNGATSTHFARLGLEYAGRLVLRAGVGISTKDPPMTANVSLGIRFWDLDFFE